MKKILLTGATDGIGFETAKMLASAGHHLLLHGRNESKLHKVKKELISLYPTVLVEIFQADFASLTQVQNFADNIAAHHAGLDVLINNAGVFTSDTPSTEDGLDVRFAVNTIAPYLLTKKLVPNMHHASRVISLGSAAQAPVDFEAFAQYSPLPADMAYAQSKLALTMWNMEMAHMHPQGPIFITVNPKSFLGSKMVMEAYGKQGYDLTIGAKIVCDAALSKAFDHASGMYFDNDYGRFVDPHPFAMDGDNRQKLMSILVRF